MFFWNSIMFRVAASFAPMLASSPPDRLNLIKVATNQIESHNRDYFSFFYPLRYKIAGDKKSLKSWGRTRNRKLIAGVNSPLGETSIIQVQQNTANLLVFAVFIANRHVLRPLFSSYSLQNLELFFY